MPMIIYMQGFQARVLILLSKYLTAESFRSYFSLMTCYNTRPHLEEVLREQIARGGDL